MPVLSTTAELCGVRSVAMSNVSRETVNNMAGAVENALYGPGGIAWRLPPDEQQMLIDTSIQVQDHPNSEDIALVSDEVGDGHLLGLFTHPPSKIQIFASSALAVGYDPVDIATHELGHRFGYDHSERPAKIAMSGSAYTEPRVRNLVAEDCPVCLIHRKLAEVVMLLDGLKQRAHLQHQIPLGLGGTIPQAAALVVEARANLAIAAASFQGREGQVRALDQQLIQLENALNQWQSPESISQAYALAYQAWDKAYDLNHIYWLQTLHGSALVTH